MKGAMRNRPGASRPSGRKTVAAISTQLPTGSARITSGAAAEQSFAVPRWKRSKAQQKQRSRHLRDGKPGQPDKRRIHQVRRLIIGEDANPQSARHQNRRGLRDQVVFPAPRKPPTVARTVIRACPAVITSSGRHALPRARRTGARKARSGPPPSTPATRPFSVAVLNPGGFQRRMAKLTDPPWQRSSNRFGARHELAPAGRMHPGRAQLGPAHQPARW